jgi:hypothetical protein
MEATAIKQDPRPKLHSIEHILHLDQDRDHAKTCDRPAVDYLHLHLAHLRQRLFLDHQQASAEARAVSSPGKFASFQMLLLLLL